MAGKAGRQAFFIRFNKIMEQVMPLVTPLGVVLGFLLGEHISGLKPSVTWLFAFITLAGAMGMNFSDFSHVLKQPLPIFVSIVCSHVAVPLLVYGIGTLLFPARPVLVIGFVLLYAIPTAVVSYMWSSIFKGDGVLSLTLILVDTLLAPIVTPWTVRLLTHSDIAIDTAGMMLSLLYMVVVPSLCGVSINTFSKGFAKAKVAPYLKPFTKIALLFVVMINASQIAGRLSFEGVFLAVFFVNILFAASGFLLGYHVARIFRYDRPTQASLTFSVGMRNISAALVLAIDFFPPEASIPVLIGVVIQQTTAALLGKALFRGRG